MALAFSLGGDLNLLDSRLKSPVHSFCWTISTRHGGLYLWLSNIIVLSIILVKKQSQCVQ